MKTTPLLLTSGNIISTRELRKTQTRRVVNPQPEWIEEVTHAIMGGPLAWPLGSLGQQCGMPVKSPYGKVGDRIAFRETWWGWGYWHNDTEGSLGRAKWRWVDETDARHPVLYDADKPQLTPVKRDVLGYHRRPSIYLPKDAWRYIVEITDIRIERLQAISEEDAIAEGIGRFPGMEPYGWSHLFPASPDDGPIETFDCPEDAYRRLWDSINGKQRPGRPDISWKENPWVWAITYRLLS